MSEQNQLAISPVTAGLVGAAAGAGVGFIPGVAPIAKGYKTTGELLALDKDKFEALKSKIEASDNADAKAEFKKLADGRTTVSEAGDALVKEQSEAKKAMNEAILKQAAETDAAKKLTIDVSAEKTALETAENKVKGYAEKLNGSASTEVKTAADEYRKAYNAEVKKITDEKTKGLGKELDELEQALAKETDATKKAELDKQIKAKKAEIGREAVKTDDVKTALAKVKEEQGKIVKVEDLKTDAGEVTKTRKAYNEKLVSSADEALKDVTADKNAAEGTLAKLKSQIADWKATLGKKPEDVRKAKIDELVGENGSLKELNIKKFSSFLEKSKGKAAAIGAAALGLAGVALAYIVGPKNEVPTDVA